MLPLRLVLFAVFQALFALLLIGSPDPWSSAAAWWPLAATLANGVTIFLLVLLYRKEGMSFAAQLRFEPATIRSDITLMAAIVPVAALLAVVPNLVLASILFGSSEAAVDLLVRPLPTWSIYTALATFPVSIALAELPVYFKYIMPRLEAASGSSLVAVLLPATFLAAQHVSLPLLPDWRFALWRLLMFLPFALFVGAIVRWRPRLLPYLMVVHAMLDAATILLFFSRVA